MKNITKLTSTKLAFATVTVILLSGCSSNRESIEQQKQQAVQIGALEEKVDKLETELLHQINSNRDTYSAVRTLEMNQKGLAKRAMADISRYSIQENDTLLSIAKEQNISLDTLLKLNPQIDETTILLIGHIINIR
ncbi:LysM peptidoglycan-binding domain-containing protein [Psychromonas ossibalaenae]|uniref:LysM peptidoglycan-binding domain-containing protein n=1 Tax=Psychromonas ossibalaenae TaxID=444922 RepID=UPI00037C33E4|nr:LysM domain-containing protein [Psychromonas ossibalaenae]